MLDSTEHDHFKCLPVLPGSVYKYNTNRLVRLSLEIPIPRSIPSTGVISDGFETFSSFLPRLINFLTWGLFYLYDNA